MRVSHSFRLTAPRQGGNILRHLTSLRRILAHPSRRCRIQRKGKTPWEPPLPPSASDTTFIPACWELERRPTSCFESYGMRRYTTGQFPSAIVLCFMWDTSKHSTGTCSRSAPLDCSHFKERSISYFPSGQTLWA